MKRLLSLFVLLGIGSIAYANGASGFDPMQGASSDMAIRYLGEIFGHVPGALDGTGSGIMSQLFYVFNQGVMVVASLWLVYSIINIMMSSVLTSQGMQKHSFAMISFRVALGMLLLVPNPSNGYSAIQTVMMKVVIEGSKLADTTWTYALNYLENGGVIFTPQSSSSKLNLNDITNYMKNQKMPAGIMNTVVQDEVCMYASNQYLKNHPHQKKEYGITGTYHLIPNPVQFANNALVKGTGTVNFPGFHDASDNIKMGDSCGQISINASQLKVGNAVQSQTPYQDAYRAVLQMALDLQPLSKALANQLYNKTPAMSKDIGSQYIQTAVLDYNQLMQPVTGYILAQAQTGKKDFFNVAKAQGWFNAGSYYWNLSRWNDALDGRKNPSTLLPKSKAGVVSKSGIQADITTMQGYFNNSGAWPLAYKKLFIYADQQSKQGSAGIEKNKVRTTDIKKQVPNPAYDPQMCMEWGGTFCQETLTQITPLFAFSSDDIDYKGYLSGALKNMVNTFQQIMLSKNAESYDPLVFVQKLGMSCLTEAGTLWSESMAASISAGNHACGCALFFSRFASITATMAWVLPMMCAIAGMLFTAGFMLNFYVPLYPYLLFMFGAMGWLLTVVEAMVAAPMVAFGMTHPEGHDFMGRAEQALMLALSVFIRPTLMVIGYMAGILLSYVAFDFVNSVIGRVFLSAFSHDPSAQNTTNGFASLDAVYMVVIGSPTGTENGQYSHSDLTDFMLIPLLMVAYGMIMIEIVNQCFSAIHLIPDMVLRWIGAPQTGDQSEKYVQAIKQGMQQASKQAGDTAGGAVSGKGKATVEHKGEQGQILNKAISAGVGAEMG